MPVRQTLSGVQLVIDPSSRDYYGYRNDCLELIPVLTTEWTDLSIVDPGIVTLELFSWVCDNLSYYIDRVSNESFLFTATQRESIIDHGRTVGYELSPNTSAVVDIAFTVTQAGTLDAEDTVVGTAPGQGQEQLRYELRQDLVCTGAGTFTGECIEGETVTENLGDSDGTPGQYFVLGQTPLSYNPDGTSSLIVSVDEGSGFVAWTEVEDLTESDTTDKHFVVRIAEDDIVTIIFGDGLNGKVPASGSANVQAKYRRGGGIIGNQVGESAITEVLSGPTWLSSVTNGTETPQGGEDKESIDEAKVNIPKSVRQNDRNVTLEDYAYDAEQVGGVVSAKAARGPEVFEVNVYVRPSGANPTPSGSWDARTETGTGLKGQVGTRLNSKRSGPIRLDILGADLVRMYIDLKVYVFSSYFQWKVQRKVERAISACLNGYELDNNGYPAGEETDIPENSPLPGGFPRNMGDYLPLSYFHHMLEEIEGVDYVTVSRFQRYPYAKKYYDDMVANGTVTGFVVNSDTKRETWTIHFISSTAFEVEGTLTGQDGTGSVGSTYTSAAGDLQFLVSAGTNPFQRDDRLTIKTGPYVGDIETDDYELITNYDNDSYSISLNLEMSGGIIIGGQ